MMAYLEIVVPQLASPFFRALGAVVLLPLGEGKSALLYRVSLAFLVALWLRPFAPPLAGVWAVQLSGDLVVGLLVAMPLLLILAGTSFAGEVFDFARGQQMVGVTDTLSQSQEAISALLLRHLVWATLLMFGWGEHLLAELARSYAQLPASSSLLLFNDQLGWRVVQFIGETLNRSLLVLMPLLTIYLLVDIGMGLVAKIAPQLSLATESFAVKIGLTAFLQLCLLQREWELDLWSVAITDLLPGSYE